MLAFICINFTIHHKRTIKLKRYTTPLLVLLASIAFSSCKSDRNSTDSSSDQNTQAQALNVKPALPYMPVDSLQKYFNNVDFVDYIFYKPTISTGMHGNNAKAQIQGIQSGACQRVTCTKIGRMIVQNQGKIMVEADIFFGSNCAYYEFYYGKELKYANPMATSGINMINQIMQNFKNAMQ